MDSQKVFSLTSSLCVIVHNCIHLCWYFFSKIFISTYLGCSLFIRYLDIIICDVLYKCHKSFARHWHIYTSTELKKGYVYLQRLSVYVRCWAQWSGFWWAGLYWTCMSTLNGYPRKSKYYTVNYLCTNISTTRHAHHHHHRSFTLCFYQFKVKLESTCTAFESPSKY